MSAYPGRYPRRWLFRQSSFHLACGLDTCSLYRPPMRAQMGVIPFQYTVLRCLRPVLSTGSFMGEHKATGKASCTAMGHCDLYLLVKPLILRRLGPCYDGSNVHSFPGHSQLAERASYEAYVSLSYSPSLRLIDIQSHRRRDAVHVHLMGREFRPASVY
jgi:hypothetical protein